MKRNQILLVFVLLIVSAVMAIGGDFISVGFQAVATRAINIATSTATIIGTIPAGCSKIGVIASNADINFGPSTVGTETTWRHIHDGEEKEFDLNGMRNPKIYFRVRNAVTGSGSYGVIYIDAR